MGLTLVKLIDPISITIAGTFTPRGAYDNATNYAVGDQVDYNGSSYIMYVDAGAGTLPTDNTKWGLIAAKGDTGATGSAGADGADGADGQGVPTGGTAGQVLAKIDGADFNTEWVDPAAGGGAVDSVNGQTGVVVLDADDIDDTSTANKFVTSTDITKLSNLSGTNTGDQTLSGLGGVPTTRTINGQDLSTNRTFTQDDIGDGTTYKQYSATEKTKLAGIEAGADVTDATNVASAGAFMKSTDDTDDITVGATNKFATAAEKTKLGHISVTQAVDLDTMESDIAGKQPLDSDLTAIAGLTPTNDDVIQRKAGAWTNRTMAQVKTDLVLVKGDVGLGNVDNTSDVNKPISTATQTALDGKVDENAAITGATKTKITYDAKGLVTGGADATTADIADSTNKRYVTDAQLTVIGNTSGTNTGDQNLTPYFNKSVDDTDDITEGTTNKFATAAEKTKLGHITVTQAVDLDTIESDTATNNAKVSNATHTGDVTGSTALTIDSTAITGKTGATPVGADYILISDTSDSGNLKKALISDLPGGGGGGSGDVVGPASAQDNSIARFDGTTGKLIQDSSDAKITDTGLYQNSGTYAPTSGDTKMIDLSPTAIPTSTANFAFYSGGTTLASASDNSGQVSAMKFDFTKAGNGISSNIRFVDATYFISGGGETSNLTLFKGDVTKNASGKIGTARGLDLHIKNSNATNNIDDIEYIYLKTPTATGTITALDGIYLEDMNTAITSFAIRTNAGNIVFNEGGDANTDVRIEGDTDANLLFTDASADKVGIGTATPSEKLSVSGDVGITGSHVIPAISTPSTPSSGYMKLFGKSMAGRILPGIIGPSGIDTTLQVGLHGNSVAMFFPANATTAPQQMGIVLTTAVTISHQQTIASSNPWQATRRTRFQCSTTAGNTSGARTAYTQWFRGNAAGYGGFFFRAQIGQNINLNGGQKFVGLCASTGALAATAGAVGALINMCGMGYDTTDADTGNWFFLRNDGSGTATKVDLGTGAARNTTHGYDLIMFMAPNGSDLYVKITNLHTGTVVLDTSYNTDLPAVNTGMAFKCEVNNGAVAAANNIEIAKLYIESDY